LNEPGFRRYIRGRLFGEIRVMKIVGLVVAVLSLLVALLQLAQGRRRK